MAKLFSAGQMHTETNKYAILDACRDLVVNQFTGTLPAAWSALKKLQSVRFDYSGLTGTLPAAWSALSSLQSAFFNDNQLTGTLPAAWSAMADMSEL
jgi:hypothetical protein